MFVHNNRELIFIMKILKANISKSIELQQRTCIWLENDRSFENVYQALTHNNELSNYFMKKF